MTATQAVSGCLGCTTMRGMALLSPRPTWLQVAPPSVER